jgi:hypothetical protein
MPAWSASALFEMRASFRNAARMARSTESNSLIAALLRTMFGLLD